MKHAVKTSRALAAGLLITIAFNSFAVTLGRAKGAVWIGRPLDVTIPVSLEPGTDASSLCVAAEVFHADSQIAAQRVKVTLEPGPVRSETLVRVRSSALVDEPVVTIYLKAGCDDKSTRRYVLLSEVPLEYSEQSPTGTTAGLTGAQATTATTKPSNIVPAAPVSGAPLSQQPLANRPAKDRWVEAAVAETRRKSAAPASGSGKPARNAKAESAAVANGAPKTPSVVRKAVPKPEPARSRLKLDPIDLLIERDPVLRASTEMLTVPVGGEERRAQAAAMWKAINATPEDIVKEAQRMDALQADVKVLRAQSEKSQATLLELKSRIEKAQAERYANNLVYALLAALLVALAAAAFFWNRARNQVPGNWWRPDGDDVNSDSPQEQQGYVRPHPPPTLSSDELDIDLDQVPSAGQPSPVVRTAAVRTAVLPAFDGSDFQSSLAGASRAVKVEELFDLQQQADFFISLGQYGQAAATLRNHISDSGETSAVAYLDLLKVYHLQGNREQYELVRKEFNDVFNAQVPEFDTFGAASRGLESYEAAMSRIVALWPSARVLDVIEESIFRKPGQGSQAFDLEAYRELLLLYAIAREVVETKERGPAKVAAAKTDTSLTFDFPDDPGDDPSNRPSFQPTSLQPLEVARSAPRESSFPELRVPPSPNLGLDIDLSMLDADMPIGAPADQAQQAAAGGAAKPKDSHLMDFDIFDMASKAHIEAKRKKP